MESDNYYRIVPTVQNRVADAAGFPERVLERFANPFLDHRLSDIALHHKTKVQVRLAATHREYTSMFGKIPPLLNAILSEQ